MQPAPGAIIGGKYRIERPLARGGMGSVWVARHVQLGSEVALKFLDASFAVSPAHRMRFEREARAAANLKSPHVVHVSDYGFEADAPYLVMELLEGEDLNQRLHRIGRMGLPDTGRVLAQAAKALRKAHEAGIAHRDLKPANLFLARVDDEEMVKVLDFGIAKEQHAAVGDATKTGEIMGSPHYMSPEQVRAEKDLDHRTDIWSVGVILFRMVTGQLPFPGDQIGPVLAKILTDPIPQATRVAPDLPPAMDTFFLRALSRDRTQRFQSIAEMVDAFHLAAGSRSGIAATTFSAGAERASNPGVATAGGVTAPLPVPVPTVPLSGSGPHGVASESGPITGPVTGTGGGFAGPPNVPQAASKRPAGVAFAIIGVLVTLMLFGMVIVGLMLTRKPTVTTASLSSEPLSLNSAAPAVTPSEPAPVTSTTSAPEPSGTTTSTTTSSSATTTKLKPSPAPTPTGTKEKWF
ncbi:MAG: serine/threonine-protein kinase [Polyangiaceae bacterium]